MCVCGETIIIFLGIHLIRKASKWINDTSCKTMKNIGKPLLDYIIKYSPEIGKIIGKYFNNPQKGYQIGKIIYDLCNKDEK